MCVCGVNVCVCGVDVCACCVNVCFYCLSVCVMCVALCWQVQLSLGDFVAARRSLKKAYKLGSQQPSDRDAVKRAFKHGERHAHAYRYTHTYTRTDMYTHIADARMLTHTHMLPHRYTHADTHIHTHFCSDSLPMLQTHACETG